MGEDMERAALICSRDTIDGAYPPLLLAINARRLGMESKVFCTFMGLNILRKGQIEKAKFFPPGFMGAIPGMASMASAMMKSKIDKANIPPLTDMLEMAQLEGVELVACKMTADMMGWSEDDFIEGVIVETAEDFLKYAKDAKLCLFI